jgi:hypothetical protein
VSIGFRDMSFPANGLGIQRGTLLRAVDPRVSQLGLGVGDLIPVGYDGEYVRCGPFTWSIEQLVQEVNDGIWEIAGVCDLSTSEKRVRFERAIERLPSVVVITLG